MEEQMRRTNAILVAFMMAFGLLAFGWTQVSTKAAEAKRTLRIKLNYTGAGTVDEQHKIYVLLFDANPFTSSSLVDVSSQPTPPAPAEGVSHILVRQSAAGKNATVTFRSVSVSPVYAVAVFDRSGTYNGQSELPSASPMGAYGKLPDKLEPIKIEPGKSLQVVLSFDDSTKTP
jgi:hypothetical protein